MKEPVVHFERGERHQYATRVVSTEPVVLEHHCIRDGENFVMPAEFYAYDSAKNMDPQEFISFLIQAGVDCSPK